MANPRQQRAWISGMTLRVASAALTFVVVLVLGVVATPSARAQTFTVLHNFTGGTDGAYPVAGLARDANGNLYGTTVYGGPSSHGTVFKVDTNGTESVLYSFTGSPDGAYPYAGLVRDATGNLYGTTYYGGTSGYGTVFQVDTSGTESVLYSFTGGTTDGCYPYGGLLQDKAGNLYGTTDGCGASGQGTVFNLSMAGKETLLHNFAGGSSDGAYPFWTRLLMDAEDDLYGVTQEGGTSNDGVVYKLGNNGTFTLLYSFAGGKTAGCYPYGTPAMDSAGNIYGTAEACGASGDGIVWKVSKVGKEALLHSFARGSSDGEAPLAGVILDAKGNLYGDTWAGGTSGLGTVYELSKKGTMTLLHSFVGSDGEFPVGGVTLDAEGNLYGTTYEGGTGNAGTVWRITK